MIVAGLYSVLWGKYKEHKEIKERAAVEISELYEVDVEKARANEGVVAVTVPVPEVAAKA